MSISTSLSNALSGLSVTSRMAEVASNNIANSLTEGYARRSLETGSAMSGVRSLGVTRYVNAGLLADRRLADAELGSEQRAYSTLAQIEGLAGTAGSPDGIAARLANFESSLINATADPSSDVRLGNVLSALGDLASSINAAGSQVQTLRQDADAAIAKDVTTINTGLTQIAQLNADISRARSAGQETSSLMDARQNVIDGISGIVPLRVLDRGNGQVGLMTSQGMTLLDGTVTELEFTPSPVITADMTLASGGVFGIYRNGSLVDPNDGLGRLAGGSLGAAMDMRDRILNSAQSALDDVALGLTLRFEDPSVDPTITGTGLLTDRGSPADPSDYIGLAGRLEVNAAVDPAQGGTLSRWRDGVGAVSAGPIGNSAQLERWQDALNTNRTLPSGGLATTAATRLGNLVSEFGQARLGAEKNLSFAQARWDNLHQAELADGVDSDRELQDLIRIEQAYAANAKVMQTISAMIQKLMEI